MALLRISLLFAVFLVASAVENKEFFERLSTTEFGQTIMETIQIQLSNQQSENSVGRVLEFLKQMKDDVTSEQKNHRISFNGKKNSCNAKIKEVNGLIQKAAEKQAEDEKLIPLKNDELVDKQKQADEKNKEEQRNLDRISQLTEERKKSRAEYEERRDELIGLIAALQQAKQIIGSLKTSLIQIDDVFAEIKQHHHAFKKHYPMKRGFNSLVQVLLETTVDPGIKADQSQVQTILSIIDDLCESLYSLQKQEMIADDAREAAFISAKTRFEQLNKHLEGALADRRAQVLLLGQKILELKNDIAIQVQLGEKKKVEKADWLKSCADEEKNFNQQTTSRNEQIDVLVQVIDIFENNFTDETRQYLAHIQLH